MRRKPPGISLQTQPLEAMCRLLHTLAPGLALPSMPPLQGPPEGHLPTEPALPRDALPAQGSGTLVPADLCVLLCVFSPLGTELTLQYLPTGCQTVGA